MRGVAEDGEEHEEDGINWDGVGSAVLEACLALKVGTDDMWFSTGLKRLTNDGGLSDGGCLSIENPTLR